MNIRCTFSFAKVLIYENFCKARSLLTWDQLSYTITREVVVPKSKYILGVDYGQQLAAQVRESEL